MSKYCSEVIVRVDVMHKHHMKVRFKAEMLNMMSA